jgi:hypothetical protein
MLLLVFLAPEGVLTVWTKNNTVAKIKVKRDVRKNGVLSMEREGQGKKRKNVRVNLDCGSW